MSSVTLENVTKRFGDVIAVNDLSLHVRDGEFAVVVGPSGCGKTTALHMLAGLEDQTSGDIIIGDRVMNRVAPKDRDIAMVFQNYALYPHMSVYENIAFGLRLRATPKDEIQRRVEEVGQMLAIGHLMARKPKQLSGGQRQRVAVGRAIARKPAVFLMDEPLSNLDAKLRIQTRGMLQELHQRIRRTTIYVTHDQVEAMTMGDRIAVMNEGLLQQFDTPENVYRSPVNTFVAGFIGSPAMNFLAATLSDEPDGYYADAGFVRIPMSISRDALKDRDLILGIRPEDIRGVPDGDFDPGDSEGASVPRRHHPVDGTIEVAEYLGNEIQVRVRVANDTKIVARLPTVTNARVGTRIRLWLDSRMLHVFDARTGSSVR